jgi:hypothetical protein
LDGRVGGVRRVHRMDCSFRIARTWDALSARPSCRKRHDRYQGSRPPFDFDFGLVFDLELEERGRDRRASEPLKK